MTDKPERLISADKLLEWAEYETWELYCDLKAEIECNTFDPDPPHQPDIQAESLIQQKDAEIAKLKKSIEGLRLITKIERSTRVQPEHERSYYSLKEQKNISDSVERER